MPRPCLVYLEGHPGVRQLPEPCGDLQGASGWAVQGLCQDLPFPAAAGMEQAGLLCPATSHAQDRSMCWGVPASWRGAPLALGPGRGKGRQTPAGTRWCQPFPQAAGTLDSPPFPVEASFRRVLFRGLEAGWKGEAPAQAVPSSPSRPGIP